MAVSIQLISPASEERLDAELADTGMESFHSINFSSK